MHWIFAIAAIIFNLVALPSFAFPHLDPNRSGLGEYCAEVTRHRGRTHRIQQWISGTSINDTPTASKKFSLNTGGKGGFLDMGLCWWRSRLQRNALMLTYFEPWKPRPTTKEALDIFYRLSRSNQVVAIPGFETFLEFTQTYESEMLQVLESWQLRNSIRGGMRTVNPLRPTSRLSTDTLFEQVRFAKMMLEEHASIPYLMLQIKGITAHSWLVLKVEEITWGKYAEFRPPYTPKVRHEVKGYRLFVQDPAYDTLFTDVYPETTSITEVYAGADTYKNINVMKSDIPDKRAFTFHLDWMVDLEKAERAIQSTCGRRLDRTLAPNPLTLGYSFQATYR